MFGCCCPAKEAPLTLLNYGANDFHPTRHHQQVEGCVSMKPAYRASASDSSDDDVEAMLARDPFRTKTKPVFPAASSSTSRRTNLFGEDLTSSQGASVAGHPQMVASSRTQKSVGINREVEIIDLVSVEVAKNFSAKRRLDVLDDDADDFVEVLPNPSRGASVVAVTPAKQALPHGKPNAQVPLAQAVQAVLPAPKKKRKSISTEDIISGWSYSANLSSLPSLRRFVPPFASVVITVGK